MLGTVFVVWKSDGWRVRVFDQKGHPLPEYWDIPSARGWPNAQREAGEWAEWMLQSRAPLPEVPSTPANDAFPGDTVGNGRDFTLFPKLLRKDWDGAKAELQEDWSRLKKWLDA